VYDDEGPLKYFYFYFFFFYFQNTYCAFIQRNVLFVSMCTFTAAIVLPRELQRYDRRFVCRRARSATSTYIYTCYRPTHIYYYIILYYCIPIICRGDNANSPQKVIIDSSVILFHDYKSDGRRAAFVHGTYRHRLESCAQLNGTIILTVKYYTLARYILYEKAL